MNLDSAISQPQGAGSPANLDLLQRRLRTSIPASELKEWLRLNPVRSAFDLGINWLSIVLGALCLAAGNAGVMPAVTLTAAFFLIGFGQYGLFILGHDGLHGCLHSSLSVNDRICRWLIYSPMLMGFEDGRRNHLDHHKRLGHEDDPDRYLHRLSDKNSFLSLLSFCLGLKTFIKTVLKVSPLGSIKANQNLKATSTVVEDIEPESQEAYADLPQSRNCKSTQKSQVLLTYVRSRLSVALWQLLILGVMFFALHLPLWYYLSHWIGPIYVCVFLADEIRAFCDHAVPVLPDSKADVKRLVSFTPNLLEKIIFAPHSMHLHAEHHLFPRVPYYNREKAYHKLKDSPDITFHKSYIGFLAQLFASLPVPEEDSQVTLLTKEQPG
ncbi:MAG: fatty acid desaturase [Candidatus Obscuribacter sp.]|nr:fatty acid desaturase [Candidatus Obscuribacter sp.]